MSKESRAAKKAAKAEKKAEKKANKQPKNPEVVKTVISAITAIICVIAIVATSVSITNKICDTNVSIAKEYPAGNGGAGTADDGTADVTPADDGTGTVDPGTSDITTDPTDKDALPADDGTADVTPADDGTADVTPADSSSSSSSSSSNSSSSSSSSTPASSSSSAPVGNNIAAIVAYYNAAANKTKAYKGTIKYSVTEGTNTKITETSFPNAAKNIANGMLPNDYPKKEVGTISNGRVKGTKTYKDGETKAVDKSFKDWIVVYGDAKMSKLTAAGVKSASCTKVAGGYKITMTLKPETVTSLSARPTNHFACMQVMELTDDDLKPFTIQDCKVNYPGGTLTAVVNESNGMLNSYGYVDPIHLTGNLKWTAIKGSAVVDATTKGSYTFTY